MVSTIQFVAAGQALRADLEVALPPLEKDPVEEETNGTIAKMRRADICAWRGRYEVTVPQSRPLSPGEVLGCTAPKLNDMDALMYVGSTKVGLIVDMLGTAASTSNRS